MIIVRTALACVVCAALASPSPAQTRAAASALAARAPRPLVAVPLSPLAAMPIPPAVLTAVAPPFSAEAAPFAAVEASLASLDRAADSLPEQADPRVSGEAGVEAAAWDRFWSGASDRPAAIDDAESFPSTSEVVRPSALRKAATRASAATAFAIPAIGGIEHLAERVAPFVEGGAVLVGTYFANRAARWAITRLATRLGLDARQVAVAKVAVGVASWTAATAGVLLLGGASHQVIATVFGTGGTVLTLALKDVLGNLLHGVNFLVTRPYSIGGRVEIDGQIGTVADMTLTHIMILKDDGREIKVRYSALADKAVVVIGAYRLPAGLRGGSSAARQPRFRGVLGAIWSAQDRRFAAAAAAVAAILFAPALLGAAWGGWAAVAAKYALSAAIFYLTRRGEIVLAKTIDTLASRNAWPLETKVVAKLAARVASWIVGGGAALRTLGFSWTTLGASLGVTTFGVGLAANNFFGSIVLGAEVLFTKPFKAGDRVKIGSSSGIVEGMTLYHVVVKLAEDRHALVPYSVVRDSVLVVEPGNNNQ